MEDARLLEDVKEHEDASGEEASSRLRDDAFSSFKNAGSDKVNETGSGGGDGRVANPFDSVARAGVAMREAEQLKDKKPDEKVTVSDVPGQSREVTVAERRAELDKIVERELRESVQSADEMLAKRGDVTSSLWEVRTKMSNITGGLKEMDALTRQESELLTKHEAALEAEHHAPSVTRFTLATYLADKGEMAEAKKLLTKIAEIDKEASLDNSYKEFAQQVDAALASGQGDGALSPDKDPFTAMAAAGELLKAGDAEGADKKFKEAIALAENVDPELVKAQLAAIQKAKTENAGNAEVLAQLQPLELAWGHMQSVVKYNYADFLKSQGKEAEAKAVLGELQKSDPEFMKANEGGDATVSRAANESDKPFDNPFDHMNKFKEAYEKGDLDTAKSELESAVKAADQVPKETMAKNKAVVEEKLKETTDPNERAELEKMRDMYDAFEHASASARLALGRFELAGKNYNTARDLFQQVKDSDPDFANKPEVKMDELMEAAHEPSTWEKVKGWAKDILKELVCDAAAVLAGVGAAVLTGWSGPAAVAVGAVAGAATYTAMKTLVFGEKFSWDMPLWGALDGATGGAAAAVRGTLVKTGGKLVSKEVAEAALVKTGQSVAAIEGMEGIKMGRTAHVLAKEGLATMGKEIGFGGRMMARLPFLGNAEYKAAKAATNALGRRVIAANLVADVGTAGTMSLIYRGGHEGYNYATGKHEDFGSFMKAYATGVAGDAAVGGAMGPMARWLGKGLSSGNLGRLTGAERLSTAFPNLGQGAETIAVTGAPAAYQAYSAYDYLTNQVEPTYQYHQVPLDLKTNKTELSQRLEALSMVLNSNTEYKARDALQPQVRGGQVVTPDENFDAEAAIRSGRKSEEDKPE